MISCRHRSEILQKPQYARLKIGQIEGEQPRIQVMQPGDLSLVSQLNDSPVLY